MIKHLDKTNVLVKENSDNTVTIMRGAIPSHNTQRIPHHTEIVVGYFTDSDLKALRAVRVTPISRVKTGTFSSYWERYVSYLMRKKK